MKKERTLFGVGGGGGGDETSDVVDDDYSDGDEFMRQPAKKNQQQ